MMTRRHRANRQGMVLLPEVRLLLQLAIDTVFPQARPTFCYRYRSWFYEEMYYPARGDALLLDQCDAAKEENIVIWTIGFETTAHGQDVTRECASSQSHFFEVDGTEITEAFESVARYINQLRLIQ